MNDKCFVQDVESGTWGHRILDLQCFSSENKMVENLEVSCPVSSSDLNVSTFRLVLETVLNNSSFKYFYYHNIFRDEVIRSTDRNVPKQVVNTKYKAPQCMKRKIENKN